jgi:hypothetical protein
VSRNELAGLAARLVLGLAGPENLPAAADAALKDGLISPALIALMDADPSEASTLFDRALHELEVSKPSQREAIMQLAHDAAAEIANGTVAPYAGAKRIWELTSCAPAVRIPELDPFIYAASEWEERPEDRVHFEQGIISEARALLGR